MDKPRYLLATLLTAMMLPGCALNPTLGFGNKDTTGKLLLLSNQSDQRMAADLIDAFTGLEDYFAGGVVIASNRDGIHRRVQAHFEQAGIPTMQGPPLYIVARHERAELQLRASYRRLQMSKNYDSLTNHDTDTNPIRMVAGKEWHAVVKPESPKDVSDGWVAVVPANAAPQ